MSIPNQLKESIILRSIWKAGGPSKSCFSNFPRVVLGLSGGNSENPEDERDYYKENISTQTIDLSICRSSGSSARLFVKCRLYSRKGLGFVASSLEEANRLVQDCTEEEYAQMVRKAQYTSYLIRNGYFTKKLFVDTIMALGE